MKMISVLKDELHAVSDPRIEGRTQHLLIDILVIGVLAVICHLATIKKYNPSINLKAGYKLKGEVIIERMQLYQYIIKKLFNKIDSNVN